MKSAQLLALFEDVADAPDAIPRLRRFILDLAVRGKLVEQCPNDEPASQLLKRIQDEKARLEKSGTIRSARVMVAHDEGPLFQLPFTWLWCRLSEVGAIVGGGTPPSGDAENFTPGGSGLAWLTPADLGKQNGLYISHGTRDLTEKGLRSSSATRLPKGSVLFTSRAPIGYTRIALNEVSTNQGFKSVVPYIPECNLYIAVYFRAFGKWIDAKAPGTTFREVSGKIVSSLPFPLPPLAEQHRIVAKVDELMALCDRLHAAQAERENRRDRLTTVSLSRLREPSGTAGFEMSANIYLNQLSRFTLRPGQLASLRQTILDMAASGKIVKQDPQDEPASEMLRRIAKTRTDRIEDGRLTKGVRRVESDGPPNAMPETWSWPMLGEITDIGTGSTPSRTNTSFWKDGTIPWIVSGSTSRLRIVEGHGFVTTDAVKAHRLRLYSPGTLLVALYGQGKTRGQVAELGIEATINQACAAICALPGFEPMQSYLKLFLRRNYHEMRAESAGGAQPNLNLQKVKQLRVPLPPLAEQSRIVAKVDELMSLCDELEAHLTTAQSVSRHLLEALLHEALGEAA